MLVLTTWWVALTAVVGYAANYRQGPVVLALSATHGVHLGDILFGLFATWWAARMTLAVFAEARHPNQDTGIWPG